MRKRPSILIWYFTSLGLYDKIQIEQQIHPDRDVFVKVRKLRGFSTRANESAVNFPRSTLFECLLPLAEGRFSNEIFYL